MDEPPSIISMNEQDRQISEIIAEERSRLRNFIRRRVPDPSDAEDILQEVFYSGDDEVLIKVRAASVNPLDWHYMRGAPYIVRIKTGLRKPKITRLGVDVADQVEAVGRNVTQFKPGDEVFGAC